MVDVGQQIQHLLPGQQRAGVKFQRFLLLTLPESSNRFQGKSKCFHIRLAGGVFTGMGMDMVCASAAQLCSVVKPCSTPWQRNDFIGSCK